jgi:hypothetical protein
MSSPHRPQAIVSQQESDPIDKGSVLGIEHANNVVELTLDPGYR